MHVWDALGRRLDISSEEFSITNAPEVAPLQLEVNLDKTTAAIDQGQALRGTWKATGGAEPYTYDASWYIRDAGSNNDSWAQSLGSVSQTADTFLPRYGISGYLNVYVEDKDGRNVSANKHFELTGDTIPAPLSLNLELNKNTISLGDTLQATWSAAGGKKPYVYSCEWSIKSEISGIWGGIGNGFTTDTSASYTPAKTVEGRDGYVEVTVTDAVGRKVSKQHRFRIQDWTAPQEELIKVDVSVDATSVAVGQPITGSWTASGGKSPYTYACYWHAKEGENDYFHTVRHKTTDLLTDQFTPGYGMEGKLYVVATDSDGQTGGAGVEFAITGAAAVDPLALQLTLSSDVADASQGQTMTANWNATGGSGEYHYEVTWHISEIASSSAAQRVRYLADYMQTSDSLAITYGAMGEVYVGVRDSDGRWSSESVRFPIIGSAAAESILTADLTLSEDQPQAGDTLTVTAAPSGGKEPYTLAYEWFYRPEQYTQTQVSFHKQAASDQLTSSATLPAAPSGYVVLTLSDASGRSIEQSKSFTIHVPSAMVRRGDANGDGSVDIIDLVAIIDYIVSGTPCTSMPNADANGDGDVDILDLVWIIDAIVGG